MTKTGVNRASLYVFVDAVHTRCWLLRVDTFSNWGIPTFIHHPRSTCISKWCSHHRLQKLSLPLKNPMRTKHSISIFVWGETIASPDVFLMSTTPKAYPRVDCFCVLDGIQHYRLVRNITNVLCFDLYWIGYIWIVQRIEVAGRWHGDLRHKTQRCLRWWMRVLPSQINP